MTQSPDARVYRAGAGFCAYQLAVSAFDSVHVDAEVVRLRIGVLALQGGFAEHSAALRKINGVEPREIRKKEDFDHRLSGLIVPGGESTTIARLLHDLELVEPLADAVKGGMPVFGTCAGLILLATQSDNFPYARIGVLDVAVTRNAYGRQLDSFDAVSDFADMRAVPMVFIRAPCITRVGANVEPLAHVDGKIVAVRQGNILAAAFHPELTDDVRVHEYFVDMVKSYRDIFRGRSGRKSGRSLVGYP